jgi:acyl-CoA thioester hydrolase
VPPTDPERAERYATFVPITTRWMDNDVYGHVNNVVFYSYFDTAANHVLIHQGGLDPLASEIIALVVESKCTYHRPLAYPDPLRAGVRVDKLGQRSVTWGIGIFREGNDVAAAAGQFVHVFVERASRRPVAIPAHIRAVLEGLVGA